MEEGSQVLEEVTRGVKEEGIMVRGPGGKIDIVEPKEAGDR